MADSPDPESTRQGIISDALILSASFHPRFGPQILTKFKPEWLGTPELREIFNEAQSYFRKFREVPSPPALAEFMRLESKSNPERLEQFRTIIFGLPPLSNVEFFGYQLEKKLQGKALYRAIKDAAVLIQEEKYDDIFSLFHRARADSYLQTSGQGSFWDDWSLRDVSLKGSPTPTGFNPLDSLLRGGLYPGELMLTIGLKSTGKSFFAVWVARSGLFYGKTIIVFTMEMSRSDLLKRIDCAVTNFDFDTYQDNRDIIKDMILKQKDKLLGDIHIVEYPSGFPTVSIIENELLETEQRLGKKVDCMVVDYIDLMRGTVVGSSDSARFGLISTAVDLRGVCGRNQIAGIVLTQSNALGKKKVFIESENAAEAYGQTWSADFVCSINEVVGRPDLRRLYLADSRRTLKKVSFLYEVNFSTAQWKECHGF